MVREGFGIAGNDIMIGANIIVEAAVGDSFVNANGKYYDNDAKRFGPPHGDALDNKKNAAVSEAVQSLCRTYL